MFNFLKGLLGSKNTITTYNYNSTIEDGWEEISENNLPKWIDKRKFKFIKNKRDESMTYEKFVTGKHYSYRYRVYPKIIGAQGDGFYEVEEYSRKLLDTIKGNKNKKYSICKNCGYTVYTFIDHYEWKHVIPNKHCGIVRP